MNEDKGELRVLREDVPGISRSELAEAVGVSPDSIKGWELGKHIPGRMATEKIVKFLGSLRKAKGGR